jgi:hypothetical protein
VISTFKSFSSDPPVSDSLSSLTSSLAASLFA